MHCLFISLLYPKEEEISLQVITETCFLLSGHTMSIPIWSATFCFAVFTRLIMPQATQSSAGTDLTRRVSEEQCFRIVVCTVFKLPYPTKINNVLQNEKVSKVATVTWHTVKHKANSSPEHKCWTRCQGSIHASRAWFAISLLVIPCAEVTRFDWSVAVPLGSQWNTTAWLVHGAVAATSLLHYVMWQWKG